MNTPPELPGPDPIPSKSSLSIRQIVAGRYELRQMLGEGGSGEVWRAYDMKLRVDVALKSLRIPSKHHEESLEAFRHEVRSAREVISPNVCRIFDLVVEEDRELISMEYIDGITLMAMLIKKGPLQLQKAGDIASQFLSGLEAIHKAGLVHCDLKPENIMITRTGRVVVMDFGIAKPWMQSGGAISGTLHYMSPEQLTGKAVDPRSDLYSAGIVLAEMIHPEGVVSQETREEIWNAVRVNPRELPESPWKSVIARTVAMNPGDRFVSAGTLARALEEVTQRIDTADEQSPYPGLAPFTAADSEYFLGREFELEAVLKKLQQLHLMALIGPSGSGKTSFLRAGLIPALPDGWSYLFCVPGDSPLLNLVQALVPELTKNTEAMQKIMEFEDPAVAIQFFREWRDKYTEALLIIDRFEELFTLNPSEVQSRYAALLGVALECDVRVLLSMRDDFLFRCNSHSSLAPIFSAITPLDIPAGSALRRALAQPALKCGYRFEDEAMVDDILSDVEKERGALPLMAFAAFRLWQKRDRSTAQLTRQAYKEIGRVAGALAQHAERALERIGTEKQPIVREIFRNLITAENTRAARETEELLSVFSEKSLAEEVLQILIDARLLTSFEAPAAEGEKPKRHVEIIHESLLTAWPRLVRWQTQDADSAQLRDQLRQAAQLWEQRNRSEDLLWTGTAFLEFQAWRQRYPGGLSAAENAFVQAMVRQTSKKRRQRRIVFTAMFVVLLGVLAVISNFWRKATASRDEAVSQSRRAEAGKVLAIGRAIPDADPSTKLAYAIASLEFAETPQARRFALQAISEGTPAPIMQIGIHHTLELSPDGKWIAVGRRDGKVELLPHDGTTPLIVQESYKQQNFIPWNSQFSPDSQLVLWTWRENPNVVKVWSIPERKIIRTFTMEGRTKCVVRNGKAFLVTDTTGDVRGFVWGRSILRVWKFDQREPEIVGRLDLRGNLWNGFEIDSLGQRIFYKKDREIYVRSLSASTIGPEMLIVRHTDDVKSLAIHPNGNEIAFSDPTGEVRLWSLVTGVKNPIRVIAGISGEPMFDPNGGFLVGVRGRGLARWELSASDAEPHLFRSPDQAGPMILDRQQRWIAAGAGSTLVFYPLTNPYPYIYRNRTPTLRFTPDGKSLISGFSPGRNLEAIMVWNMPGKKPPEIPLIWQSLTRNAQSLDIDPSGKFVLAAIFNDGLHRISLADAKDSTLRSLSEQFYTNVAISPDGASAAAVGPDYIEIWDLNSGDSRILEKSKGKTFWSLRFGPDGVLYSGESQLCQWNLKDNSVKILAEGKGHLISDLAVSHSGRYLAAATWLGNKTSQVALYDLQKGSSTQITSHGNRVFSVAFDSGGTRLITGDRDGNVRVGPMSGETPHLLLGHESVVIDIAVHPDGKWIATREEADVVRLWQMPQQKPLESLPYNEFLNHLRSLTNVRAAADNNSPTGYRIQYEPVAGWEKISDSNPSPRRNQ